MKIMYDNLNKQWGQKRLVSQKQKNSESEEWLCEHEILNNTSMTSQNI